MKPSRKIRVLVVDDSAVVRRVLTDLLRQDPGLEVVGQADDPYTARDLLRKVSPDVITLDIEMPRMDGLTFLRLLQQHRPLPVVIVSSLTPAGSHAALAALEMGAVDVIAKPNSAGEISQLGAQLAQRVKAAALSRPQSPGAGLPQAPATGPSNRYDPRQVILLGASTGGTEAVKSVLTRLPADVPGLCIAQHIPAGFSRAFAGRLNELCALEVREAVAGDLVRPGLALVAPGDQHLRLTWQGGNYRVALDSSPPRHHVRPAVDHLFESAADCAGPHAVAGLLTGMGTDGAAGLQRLKAAGAATFAQDEATCVVYGMPRAAVELGAVDHILPLSQIPAAILNLVRPPAAPVAPVPVAASSDTRFLLLNHESK